MADDFFEDGPQQEESAPAENEASGGDDGNMQDGDSPTVVVNKTAYPDAKPGDEFKMRVVRVHDEEMECEVIKDGDGGEGDQMPAGAPMPAGPPEME